MAGPILVLGLVSIMIGFIAAAFGNSDKYIWWGGGIVLIILSTLQGFKII